MEKEASSALKPTTWEDRFRSAFTVGAILGAADPILRYELDSIPLQTLATKCTKHAVCKSTKRIVAFIMYACLYIQTYIHTYIHT